MVRAWPHPNRTAGRARSFDLQRELLSSRTPLGLTLACHAERPGVANGLLDALELLAQMDDLARFGEPRRGEPHGGGDLVHRSPRLEPDGLRELVHGGLDTVPRELEPCV